MSAFLHTVVLVATVGLVYAWLQSPLLEPYALQAFATSVVVYFGLKRLRRAKLWHLTPHLLSWEMVVATFAFLLVIGATGNLDSPVWALTYVHLFFLVLATPVGTSITMALAIMLFHYTLGGYDWARDWPAFASLPILTVLFLFAKHQHEEVIRDQVRLRIDATRLAASQRQEAKLVRFLLDFVNPKLEQMKQLTIYAQDNAAALVGQITLLQVEIQKKLGGGGRGGGRGGPVSMS